MASEIPVNMENVAVVEAEVDSATSAPDSLDVDHKKNEDFIVRMNITLFNFFYFTSPKITPAQHTRRLPFASRWSSSSVVDKDAIEAEWKAMFQHLNDILERYKTVLSTANNNGPVGLMNIYLAIADLWIIIYAVPHVPYGYRVGMRVFFYGLLAVLWILFIKDAIHTNITYSDNSNRKSRMVCNSGNGSSYMNNRNDNIDTNRHYKRTMATNRLLLQVDNMSGFEAFMGCVGLWFVAMFIAYCIEQCDLSGWWYNAIFLIPMALVSLYVLYHIGGCRSLAECNCTRDLSRALQLGVVWASLVSEIRRHNDVLTNFTLRPKFKKVGFFRFAIVIDIYFKNTNTLGLTKQSGGDPQQQP